MQLRTFGFVMKSKSEWNEKAIKQRKGGIQLYHLSSYHRRKQSNCFDKKDELLMETEHIEFQIKVPKPQFMGRVNRI